ncbi:hypothetical protein Hanom_Chr13g01223381 [Helianthus anomalus]
MNSLRPQGLFLANHFDDVDILLIKRIHQWAPNSFPLFLLNSFIFLSHAPFILVNSNPNCSSLSNQSKP